MASLFPLLEAAEPETGQTPEGVKPYREIKWDDVRQRPVWRAGNPVWATGADAVKSWAVMALYTARRSKDLFSAGYGCSLPSLAGRPFSAAVRQSEAVRMVRECLTVNPYITDVRQVSVALNGSEVTLSCTVSTIFGEVAVQSGLPVF